MEEVQKHFDAWVRVALVILLALLAVLCGLLLHQYKTLRDQQILGGPIHWLTALHGATSTPMTDPNFIQSWMTYDYVDHIYDLPADYLRMTLHIADGHYPRVSIAESAEAQQMTIAAMTAEVRKAIGDYLVANGK